MSRNDNYKVCVWNESSSIFIVMYMINSNEK